MQAGEWITSVLPQSPSNSLLPLLRAHIRVRAVGSLKEGFHLLQGEVRIPASTRQSTFVRSVTLLAGMMVLRRHPRKNLCSLCIYILLPGSAMVRLQCTSYRYLIKLCQNLYLLVFGHSGQLGETDLLDESNPNQYSIFVFEFALVPKAFVVPVKASKARNYYLCILRPHASWKLLPRHFDKFSFKRACFAGRVMIRNAIETNVRVGSPFDMSIIIPLWPCERRIQANF